MRVVVDTNVLISAVLKGRKPREVIQFISDSANIQWVVSQEIVAEYKEVLNRRKFKLTDEVKQEWLNKIDTIPFIIDVALEIDFPRDVKDAKFLACVIAAEADFLITGDKDFDEVQKIGKATIISVSLFKKLLIDTDEEKNEGAS
ncbi:putative toxin-antitoxin system toxin component, PIN family [Aphanothece hegewaldii CCALA 016]|uniref:Putative toxin-antitoxin system toxin component, PIN family n=1 Tax=Aphanothece hegewaldii CCALA 016 TaxID=2107694 RepID=A0A2T1LTH4_9CHRO|nr:putative toxin-antitoxin system toxin component, PIN family [Aphanothece hegewaldii]PSF33916.1 putative toxin-antitoxin system toxin component, PIN family [Aphanothece hegewaldii CCALA 016]